MNEPPSRIERWCAAEVNDWLNENQFGIYAPMMKKLEVTGRSLMLMNTTTLTKDVGMKVCHSVWYSSHAHRVSGLGCTARVLGGHSARH
jgi:hypothetical protein